jgi:hypothetical protein
MKIPLYFLFASFVLSPFISSSQGIQSIKGKVVTSNNEPAFGNVYVLSTADSSFIKGTIFEDTTFVIKDLNHNEVLLKFTALAYADTTIKVVYNGQASIDLGTIIMQVHANVLSTVTVVGKIPLVKYNSDGNLEINVDKTILSASSSVTEILSKSPNIIENNGQFSVFGKGEAIIFLNGRLITNEQLSAVPVSQIVKIDIISNPSSRYDAEGKAVINVVTKQNQDAGILGTITQQITHSDFAGTNAQTFFDLTYVKNRLSLVGNYSFLSGSNREFLHTTRTRPSLDDPFKSDLTTDWQRKLKNYSNFGLGLQYNLDKKSVVNLAYSGFLEKMGGNTKSNNAITYQAKNSFYKSDIEKDEVRKNNSITLNYNRSLDSLGSTLFIGSQYSQFTSEINDFISENRTVNSLEGIRLLKNGVGHNIDVSSTQGDFTKIFKGNSKLDLGIKFSYVATKSATDFFINEGGSTFIIDKILSNDFQYYEKISAAYFNYSSSFKKVNLAVGLRSEWTDYELNTSVGGGQLLSDNYVNIFPNLQLNTSLGGSMKMRFAYVARITRPRYQALNPYVIYQDPFTTIEGNPNLIPEKTHALEMGANYKGYDVRVGYNHLIDPLDAAALRGTTPLSYILKGINLEKGHSYFAALAKNITHKSFTSINTFNISYNKLFDNKYDFNLNDPAPQVYFHTSNSYNVKDLFKLQLLAWYMGRKKDGLNDDFARSLIMIGVEKDVLDNKVKLRLIANDIFNRTFASGTYDVGKTVIFFNRRFNNSYIRGIATWNFGKIKKSNYKIRSTGQAENSRVS